VGDKKPTKISSVPLKTHVNPSDYSDYITILEPQIHERGFQNNHRHAARRRCGRFRKCKSRNQSM